MIPWQKGPTMDAWFMILVIAVIGKLLYELNPAAWKNAAAWVEHATRRRD